MSPDPPLLGSPLASRHAFRHVFDIVIKVGLCATLCVFGLACTEDAALPPAPPPLPPAAPPPPPPPNPAPVAVPQPSLAQPVEPEDGEADSKAVVAELRETLIRGLTNKRNRQRLARVLEAARRDDRPMVLRVLAEAEMRAQAGAADALEWRAVMGRLQELADDDAEPPIAEVADRIEAASQTVRRASAQEREAMWQRRSDEQARVDRYGGEAFGTAGTRLKFNKPGEGQVTRRVYTDGAGDLLLEKDDD